MSDLSIDLHWHRAEAHLKTGAYSAEHTIQYNNRFDILADAAPDWGGDPENTNPEQALAAALSSCHMMTFLALAAKMRWPVKSYKDNAHAFLGKNSKGMMSVNKIELNPISKFDNDFSVSKDEMDKMQDRSHRYCFIANSLSDEVEIKINI